VELESGVAATAEGAGVDTGGLTGGPPGALALLGVHAALARLATVTAMTVTADRYDDVLTLASRTSSCPET
jgi:hypothetical protein